MTGIRHLGVPIIVSRIDELLLGVCRRKVVSLCQHHRIGLLHRSANQRLGRCLVCCQLAVLPLQYDLRQRHHRGKAETITALHSRYIVLPPPRFVLPTGSKYTTCAWIFSGGLVSGGCKVGGRTAEAQSLWRPLEILRAGTRTPTQIATLGTRA